MKFPFLLSLGRHSKQAGDEGDLPVDVSFAHPSDLSLANHVHDLIPLQCSPCRFHGKEAHPGLDQPLDEAVVLLDQVIQVFDLPQFDLLGKDPSSFDLYVNGQKIDSASDNTYSQGFIGLTADAINNATMVTYQDARVWTI